MYVCGPTTYNFIHLGNARPLIVFDTVRRYLEYRGYEVTYVQNFTDVDDKIIKRGQEEGEDPLKLAARFIEEYFRDADALGVKRADIHPRVSQHIPQIIAAIQGLIDKGFAYEVDGDVFYRVKAFKGYGKLSGRSLDEMLAGARVDINDLKEEVVDFALWKKAKAGEPSWDSPWGPGRPGWHIECSVMSTYYLGNTIDIHGGGNDLIFPHHENEIAQAEALSGQTFVNYWMHNGFITVNNEKMSKSLGNFFIVRDILAKFPPDVVRFYLISIHYRSPLDFDDSKLEEARRALLRLKNTRLLAGEFLADEVFTNIAETSRANQLLAQVRELHNKYIEAMDDDFNTAKAIGHLFEMAHIINTFLAEADSNSQSDKAAVKASLDIFNALGDVLGIFIEQNRTGDHLLTEVLNILQELRQILRSEKQFKPADAIRDFFVQMGVSVEDTSNGSRLRLTREIGIEPVMDKLIELRTGFKNDKDYTKSDYIRDALKDRGILLEDTREGVRWKLVDA